LSFRISALLQAVSSGDEDAVNAIIGGGGDVNACNAGGQTPLILAVIAGHSQILPPLLRAGANPLVCDNTGLNAIDWAERKGRTDLARSLSQQLNLSTAPFETTAAKPRPARDSAEPLPSEPVSPDEKSRRFVAGLKQRLEEKAELRKTLNVSPEPLKSQSAIEDIHRTPDTPLSSNGKNSPLPEKPAIGNFERTPETPLFSNGNTSPLPEKPEPVKSQPAIENILTIPETPVLSNEETDFQPKWPEPQLSIAPSSVPTVYKRCPKCNRVYDSELVAYCAYHMLPLIDLHEPTAPLSDVDEPLITAKPNNSTALFWSLILMTLFGATLVGLLLSTLLFERRPAPATHPTALVTTPPKRKGIPVPGRELVGKAIVLREAEAPSDAVKEPTLVTVRVKIDKGGRVYSASSTDSETLLRESAMAAAKQSVFSAAKVGVRGAEGTITYTFSP
jgi:TonB family protein